MKIAVLGAIAIEGKAGLAVWFIALGRIGCADRATVFDHIRTKNTDFAILVCVAAIILEMQPEQRPLTVRLKARIS